MALRFLSSETIDGNLSFIGSTLISSNTADGSDNAQIVISGAGAQGDTRGASIHLSGNENGNGGLLQLRAGDGSVGGIRLYTGGSERMRISEPLITFPTITELRGDIASAKFAVGNMGDASSQMMVSSRGFLTLNVSNTGSALDALERLRITATGAISVGSTGTNYGTSGQVLTSGGNSNPTWTTPTTGDVTGSGSANYVTYWTGAKTVSGTANFQYDGSINLGLGSAPTAFGTGVPTLLFKGTNSTNGRAGAIWFKENDGTDTAALYVTDGGDGYGTTLCAYQGDINFATSSLADRKMTITSAGKVGIGTTSPGSKLTVDTNIDSNSAPLLIQNTGLNDSGQLQLGIPKGNNAYATGSALGDVVIRNTEASSKLILGGTGSVVIGVGGTDFDPRMTINSSGNVGISSTVPEKNLSIGSAQGDGIQFNYDTTNNYRNQILNYWNSSADSRMDFNIARISGQTPENIMSVGYNSNVGIGTTSPSSKLSISGSQTAIDLTRGTAGDSKWGFSSDSARLYIAELSTGSTDYIMTFTESSGNVGIGTTTPAGLLTIKGTGDAIRVESTNTGIGGAQMDLLHFTTSPADGDYFGMINMGGYYTGTTSVYGTSIRSIWTDVSARDADLSFLTNNSGTLTESMRITSDGMIGVGMTPSTAGSSTYMLQMYNPGSQCFLAIGNGTSGNGPLNGLVIGNDAGNAYIYNREATTLQFGTNDSTKMVILSGGNVGIGVTNPSRTLSVLDRINIKASSTSGNANLLFGDSDDDGIGQIKYDNSNNSMQFQVNNSIAATILSNGNIGIGYTSPGYSLEIASSGSAGRARVYADGNGAIYSANGDVQLWTNNTAYAINFYSANKAAKILACTNAGSVTVTGDLVAYGSPSDKRLKENIKPIESALDKVEKLQGVTFDWKESDSILDIKEDIGFIAQDVQEVVPELVRENEDGKLSMRHQGVIPILVEAMKEQQKQIDRLEEQIKKMSS